MIAFYRTRLRNSNPAALPCDAGSMSRVGGAFKISFPARF
jgi:hypothetical protein